MLYKRDTQELVYSKKNVKYLGRLPQGAPTSPMLSNVVFYELDELIYKLVQENGGLSIHVMLMIYLYHFQKRDGKK
mgnify:CR=1 FL=1